MDEADEVAMGGAQCATTIPLADRAAWTLAETGAMLGVSKRKVYDLLREGMPCVYVGQVIRVLPGSVARWLEGKEGSFRGNDLHTAHEPATLPKPRRERGRPAQERAAGPPRYRAL